MLFTTVTLLLHNDGGELAISDYVDSNGKFVNIGVQALAALQAKKAIHITAQTGEEVIVPYHAVLGYSVTKEEGEYTKPEDDFCKPVCDGGSDDGKPDSELHHVEIKNGQGGPEFDWENSDFADLEEMVAYFGKAYTQDAQNNLILNNGFGGVEITTGAATYTDFSATNDGIESFYASTPYATVIQINFTTGEIAVFEDN